MRKILIIGVLVLGLMMGGAEVRAEETSEAPEMEEVFGTLSSDVGGVGNRELSDLTVLINNIINFLLFAAGVFLLVNKILAGISIITKGSKPGEFATAMKRILFSAIGIVIVFLAYVVVGFVVTTLFGTEVSLTGDSSGGIEKVLEGRG